MVTDDDNVLLSEATLPQIFVAIAKRVDYAILGTASGAGTANERLRMMYSGGKFPAIGLARTMQTEIQKSILEANQMANPEDNT